MMLPDEHRPLLHHSSDGAISHQVSNTETDAGVPSEQTSQEEVNENISLDSEVEGDKQGDTFKKDLLEYADVLLTFYFQICCVH